MIAPTHFRGVPITATASDITATTTAASPVSPTPCSAPQRAVHAAALTFITLYLPHKPSILTPATDPTTSTSMSTTAPANSHMAVRTATSPTMRAPPTTVTASGASSPRRGPTTMLNAADERPIIASRFATHDMLARGDVADPNLLNIVVPTFIPTFDDLLVSRPLFSVRWAMRAQYVRRFTESSSFRLRSRVAASARRINSSSEANSSTARRTQPRSSPPCTFHSSLSILYTPVAAAGAPTTRPRTLVCHPPLNAHLRWQPLLQVGHRRPLTPPKHVRPPRPNRCLSWRS